MRTLILFFVHFHDAVIATAKIFLSFSATTTVRKEYDPEIITNLKFFLVFGAK